VLSKLYLQNKALSRGKSGSDAGKMKAADLADIFPGMVILFLLIRDGSYISLKKQ